MELENILGRSPQTVYDLAMAAVARTQPKKRERGASETKDGCPSGAELDLIEPLTLQEESKSHVLVAVLVSQIEHLVLVLL